MTATPAYSVRSLIHAYDDRVVLDIPALDIPSGQICAFLGPNGCGKTTLLSILAMLLHPASGSVMLHGTEMVHSHDRQLRRLMTLVHQKPFLFSTTVMNNLAYGLKILDIPSKEIRDRVHTIARETGLSGLLEKPARKLSGGEAQRVALARALVLETPILLLDEPTNSLDDAAKPIFAELLHKANADRNTTVIMATHDLDLVSALSGRILRMAGGRVADLSPA